MPSEPTNPEPTGPEPSTPEPVSGTVRAVEPNQTLVLLRQCSHILTIGWAVTMVLPSDEGDIPYGYTVGLTRLGAAERVITGPLPVAITHFLLNDLAARVLSGQRFTHQQRLDDLLADRAAVVIDGTANDQIIAGSANHLYGVHVRLQQVLWPDTADRFPFDDGYDHDRFPQPLLTPPTTHDRP